MKKSMTLLSVLLVSLLLLTACSTTDQSASAQTVVEADSSSGGALVPEGNPAVTPGPDTPLAMQLALGTFKLEETDYPVDAEQASALLPLWKATRSLSQSETVATEELQAVINQIQGTMSSDQIGAIESMNLTFRDVGTIAEELGLDFGSSRFGDLSPEMQATMQAARESGQFPQGGFGRGGDFPGGGFPGGGPGDGGGGPGGGFRQGSGLSPEQQQTAVAARGGFRQAGLGVPTQLLDAVIKFLENKVQ